MITKIYHGTFEKYADLIEAQGRFKCSNTGNDWLGAGAYFFEGSPLKALSWTRTRPVPDESDLGKPVVIEAEIDTKNILDLVKAEDLFVTKDTLSTFESNFLQASGQKNPVLRDHSGERFRLFSDVPLHNSQDEGDRNIGDQYIFPNPDDDDLLKMTVILVEKYERREIDCVRAPFWEGQQLREGSYLFDHTNIQICIMPNQSEGSSKFFYYKDAEFISNVKRCETVSIDELVRVRLPI